MTDTKLSIFGRLANGKSRIRKFLKTTSMETPPILFDRDFYVQHYAPGQSRKFDAWKHYCDSGHLLDFNPHPLFDVTFYRERYLQGQYDVNPLLHYIQHAHDQLDPHPLLDIKFYVGQLDRQTITRKTPNQTWLEYFLTNNLNDLKSASKEFSTKSYLERHPEIMKDRINPLYHFVTYRGPKERFSMSDFADGAALFDISYYLATYKDIADSGIDPWQHYCEYGFREGRNPHPIFDTNYYRTKYLATEPDTNPLLHYLANGFNLLSTHPLFDAEFYGSQIEASFTSRGISPLQHFLQFNLENQASPSPLFFTARYLEMYPDIAECNLVPLYHYLRHGRGKRRFVVDKKHLDQLPFVSHEGIEFAKLSGMRHADFIQGVSQLGNAPVIVCVSHQASLTGAPLIILKIAESIRAKYGVEIINVVFRPGELNKRFETIGPTMNLNGATPDTQGEHFADGMDLLVDLIRDRNIVGAVVNSAESRHILQTLKSLEIPTVSLIHENAKCYSEGKFDSIAQLSDRIIFPSEYVQAAALENANFSDRSTEILPQGLLNEKLLEIEPKDPMNKIRADWDIPEDATLVLSCGTADGRKGIDIFLSTAIVAINQSKRGSIYFGWLGGNGFRNPWDQRFWLDKDLEAANVSQYVKLMGSTDDVAPYLQACDLLFLPSRIDPFPCVVNEAMAAGKPVVLFEGGSGCVSMIGDSGGAVVPYGDVAKAANAIHELGKYPLLRKEMGLRNRDYVAQNLNFDQYVDKVFDSLLSAVDLVDQKLPNLTLLTQTGDRSKNAKKVIFSLPAWRISGVNTFVENLIMQLREQGFDASILFTTRDPSRISQAEEMPKVPYRFLTAKSLPPEERRNQMKKYLEQNAPCVFVPNYDYTMSALTPDLPTNVGVLGVLHSDEDEHYLHGYQMGHYWDSIVAVSETIKSRLLELNPAFADRTRTICYGIPVQEDAPVKRRNNDKLRLVYTGRIVQTQKRIFDFITLMEKLDARRISFEITFIGGGGDEVAFQNCLKPWVNRGVARYLGSCPSEVVSQELKTHDALILMSEFEGLPLSLLEAMAEGCVPVVTEIPSGISEILVHGENGMLSPLGDVDAMVDNVAKLHRDRGLLEKTSTKAYKTLSARGLTVAHMGKSYKTVLDEIFEKIDSREKTVSIPLHSEFVRKCLKVA